MAEPLTPRPKLVAIVAVVVTIGACIAFGVAAARMSNVQFFSEPPSRTPAAIGGCIGAVLGWMVGRRLPKQRGARWGLSFVFGLYGALAGAFAPATVDVWLDREPAAIHETTIVARTEDEVQGRHGKRDVYFLEVVPWSGMGDEPVRLRVPIDTIRKTRVGQTVRVHVRPGWLGHAWIERIDLGPLPDP